MQNKNSLQAKILYFFEIFMVFIYLGIGLLLFVVEQTQELLRITNRNRIILAGTIFAYGLFKIYRVIQKKKQFALEDESN